MRSRIPEKKRGAALLIALVILMAVLVLALALARAVAPLAGTVQRRKDMEQCRELAWTLSRELEEEIRDVPAFASYEEQKEAEEAGEYPLYFYLRRHVGQDGWPAWNPGGEEPRGAVREFRLLADGVAVSEMEDGAAEELTVGFYWISQEPLTLVARVTCKVGEQVSMVTASYPLEEVPYASGSDGLEGAGDRDAGPDGNRIRTSVRWVWGAPERE